nr:DUF6377 domain-containing protein [Prolixibacteraceae bacterium]
MRKLLFVSILLLTFSELLFSSNNTDRLLNTLDSEIENRNDYLSLKTDRINQLKIQLDYFQKLSNTEQAYNTCTKLLDEYQSFSYDSAFKYVFKLHNLAIQTGSVNKIADSKIRMGFTFLSSGLFKEALDTLDNMNLSHLNNSLKKEYYNVIARTYYDLADYNNDEYFGNQYRRKGTEYLDSALNLIAKNTSEYWSAIGLRRMKSNDIQGSADAFNFLISQFEISEHTYAIATSSLGYLYSLLNRNNDAIDMLANAAIADIKSSTKETVALRNLAVHLLEKGDINRAYKYIKIALNDATEYNARHRKVEVGAVLPIIEGERLTTVERQRKQLLNYSFVVSMLSVLVLSFFSIIFFQYRKLNKVKLILQETNNSLRDINHSLREANKIKQEYIGYFFNVNSDYIDKIEDFQKKLHRKIVAKQFNDLESILT